MMLHQLNEFVFVAKYNSLNGSYFLEKRVLEENDLLRKIFNKIAKLLSALQLIVVKLLPAECA